MNNQFRLYDPEKCAVFCRVKEEHGGISNMAGGFLLNVNGVDIRTSEALYQVCRFPFHPDIQKKIIEQASPMRAKMIGKPYRANFNREDFEKIKVTLMRWCLRVKLLQNWEKFSAVLLETGDLPIVEKSTKQDDFWGALVIGGETTSTKKRSVKPKYMPSDERPAGFLYGYNIMGRLPQEMRENIKTGIDPMSENFTRLAPLPIGNFLLYGKPIEEILRR